MAIQIIPPSLFFLVGLLAAAVYFDFRYHRIPNALTFGGALAGLVFVMQADASGYSLALSLGGAVLGMALFLPLYALGKMGAGDVKLLAMVGIFVGPTGVFWASMWSLIAGGVLAFLWLLGAWGVRQMAYRTIGTLTATGIRRPSPDTSENGGGAPGTGDPKAGHASALKSKMPYAAAIAIGAIVAARLQLVT